MIRALGLFASVILLMLLGQHWPAGRTTLLRPAEPVRFSEWCVQEDVRYSRPLRHIPNDEALRLVDIFEDDDTPWQSAQNQKKSRRKFESSRCLVYRAGTAHANAMYGRIGSDGTGRPSYYSQTSMVSLSYNGAENRWEMIDDDTTHILYASYSRSITPPIQGWQLIDGTAPIPAVRAQRNQMKSYTKSKVRLARIRRAKLRRST